MATRIPERIEITLLWRQIAALLRGGMPLPAALLAVGRDAETEALRGIAGALRGAVEDGRPLSEAMADHPDIFDPAAVACVEAGERGGTLPDAAAVLADHGARMDLLRLRGRMILAYPAILLCFTTLVAGGIAWQVVPHSRRLAVALGGSVTAGSWAVAALVLAYAILLATLATVLLGAFVLRRPESFPALHRIAERALLRLPYAGRYRRAIVLARFTRTLAALVRTGTPLHEALPLAGAASGSASVAEAARRAASAVRDGGRAADALAGEAAFDEAALWALRVAEERGEFESALGGLADWFDETASIAAATFLNAAEPVAVALVGLVCAGTILTLAVPSMNLYALLP